MSPSKATSVDYRSVGSFSDRKKAFTVTQPPPTRVATTTAIGTTTNTEQQRQQQLQQQQLENAVRLGSDDNDNDNDRANDDDNDNRDNYNDNDNDCDNEEIDGDDDGAAADSDCWSDDLAHDSPQSSSSMPSFSPEALAFLHSHRIGNMGCHSHISSSSRSSSSSSSAYDSSGMGTVLLSPIQPLMIDGEGEGEEVDDDDDDDEIFGNLMSEDSPEALSPGVQGCEEEGGSDDPDRLGDQQPSYNHENQQHPFYSQHEGRQQVNVPPRSPLISASLRSYLSRHSPSPSPSSGKCVSEGEV